MKKPRVFLDLFAGTGGFALGAYWAAMKFDKHYFSEVDGYAAAVYKKRFPEAVALGDVRKIKSLPEGEYVIAGGFPCQPHSQAGKRKGAEDGRDLWPECVRMLRLARPRIALFENVPAVLVSNGGRFFNGLLSDISESGYDAEWEIVSAFDIGAPQLRKRIWLVAYPKSGKRQDGRRIS